MKKIADLISAEVCGIKNIEKPIKILFRNETIKNHFLSEGNNVKAIYGRNGSGKTAFITGIALYKNIVQNAGYLNINNNSIIKKIINKKTNYFSIKMTYSIFLSNIPNFKRPIVYSHFIKVGLDKSGQLKVMNENLSFIKGRTINEHSEILFETIDGEISQINQYSNEINKYFYNLASDNSLVSLVTKLYRNESIKLKNIHNCPVLQDMLYAAIFADEIGVHVNGNLTLLNVFGDVEKQIEERKKFNLKINTLMNSEIRSGMLVAKKSFTSFERKVSFLTRFMKILKPGLKDIVIDKKVFDSDLYSCDLVYVYDDYSVDYDYESEGIRKLTQLYSCLDYANQGRIVFIDELDDSLHDAYLGSLIEYFEKYGKGQLCFTTHNSSTMENLKKFKNSIDIIGENDTVYSWAKTGNLSPSKAYRHGVLPGSYLGIEDFDFLSSFDNEE